MPTVFTLAHVSDLHFSPGAHKDNTHQHSIPRLQGIERILRHRSLDRLLVSGDLTNDGSRESLLRAHSWLFTEFEISATDRTGLRMPTDKVGIVPGNHDAFNADANGQAAYRDCWQKSLQYYNEVFPDHQFAPDAPCRYEWLERDGRGILLLYIDTCYLGDPTLERQDGYVHLLKRIPRIARGLFKAEQSEQVLNWFDLGAAGKLPHPRNPDRFIPREQFLRSLKIVVAHHYLFEPRGTKLEPLLQMGQVNSIFINLASADIDVYLCGHKHHADFDQSTYGARLDRRGKSRHLINLYRRMIGIASLPARLREKDGTDVSKAWTFLLSLVALGVKLGAIGRAPAHQDDAAYIERMVSVFEAALEDPKTLEADLAKFLRGYGIPREDVLDGGELRNLQAQLRAKFTRDERKSLAKVAHTIQNLGRQLASRPFVQIMAGSAAKESGKNDKARSFNIYTITADGSGYLLVCERFKWDRSISAFTEPAERFVHGFADSYRAILE